MSSWNRRSRARVAGGALLSLATVLAGMLTGVAGATADDARSAHPDRVEGSVLALTARTTSPAPRRGAGYTAYPVPTSAAGLGNIETAPNGDMWFVMEDANRVARLSPQGQIEEFDLGPTTTGDGTVPDLTIAPDGSVWVVYDSGWKVMHLRDPSVRPIPANSYSLGRYPYGKDIEMGPDGHPWVTMRYDEVGVARILPDGVVWHPNSPECEGHKFVGRAIAQVRGQMWCQDSDKLTRLNADASGGTTFPLPAGVSYPFSMSAGPTGSVWFARHSGGTMFTSPSEGDVGWLDERTGRTTIFNTGSRTAPNGLIQGPDKHMWFASVGAAKGIGHIDAKGRGALTKVGNYEPGHLTFDKSGFLWFTDAENNAVVRVDPKQLHVTDVSVGDKSVFVKADPHVKAAPKVVGSVAVGKGVLKAKGNKVRLPIACPKNAKKQCRGVALLRHKKHATAYSKEKSYRIPAGKKKVVVLALNKAGKKAVKPKATKVRATLLSHQHTLRDTKIQVRR